MVWDKTQPPAGIEARVLDNMVRDNNSAIEDAIGQDHDFETGGTQTGKHNKVSLIETADIGTGAEGLPILGAQTVDGKPELVYTDEDDNDIQITSNGSINSSGITLVANSVDSDNYVDGSIDNEHLSDNAVDSDELADGAVDFTHLSGDLVITEAEGISSNDNNTTIPTSAAVKDYVDTEMSGAGGGGYNAATVYIVGTDDSTPAQIGNVLWNEYDLSGTIGSNVALCIFSVRGSTGSYPIGVRPHGATEINISLTSKSANVYFGFASHFGIIMCPSDADGKIDYATTWANNWIILKLIGYIA